MIEKQQHGKALAMKADADLTFDSLWLGIQGSGLEAASMGQMVVAGDASVRDLYIASEVGSCPYTFANDKAELTAMLERAITDTDWYKAEAKRVGQYVTKFHDYAAVAKRYEGMIAKATGWTNVETKKRRPNGAA
jgi:glycosyltransferase involved in cell wall biosynthesis